MIASYARRDTRRDSYTEYRYTCVYNIGIVV